MRNEQIEILVEEPSMKNFLELILPKILPSDFILNENCFIRVHEGKQHLLKSIPQKIRAYNHWHMPVKVIIVHDKDSNNCIELKQKIKSLVKIRK